MSIADLEKIGRAQAPVVHETQIPHGVMDVRNIQRSPSIISLGRWLAGRPEHVRFAQIIYRPISRTLFRAVREI